MRAKLSAGIVICLLIFTPAFGQRRLKADTRLHPGITGGIGISAIRGRDFWGNSLNDKFLLVFNCGGNINIPLTFIPDLYVQPGLMFSGKGARQDLTTDNITRTIKLFYIEVPVNILYRPPLGDGHLLLGAGPFAACGVTGKERTKTDEIITELSVRYTNSAAGKPSTYIYYRRMDAGANAFIGYESFNGIFCQLNGQAGFLKINSDYNVPNDQTIKRNFGLGISAGYRFR